MKKIIIPLLILAILLPCITLVGCGAAAPADEVLLARAKELIPATALINRFFYVEGMPLDPDAPPSGGYRAVDMTAIRALGFENLEGILASMNGVWSSAYCTRFRESSLFSTISNGNSLATKYCFDYYDPKTNAYEGIFVSAAGLPNQTDPVEYLTDTLRVKEKTSTRAKLQLDVRVTDHTNPTEIMEDTITITLVKEKDMWLLDSNLAVKYFKPQ